MPHPSVHHDQEVHQNGTVSPFGQTVSLRKEHFPTRPSSMDENDLPLVAVAHHVSFGAEIDGDVGLEALAASCCVATFVEVEWSRGVEHGEVQTFLTD